MRLRKAEKLAIAAVLAAQNALANKRWYEESRPFEAALEEASRRACYICGVRISTERDISAHQKPEKWVNAFIARMGETAKQMEVYVTPSSKERERLANVVAVLNEMPYSEYINHTTWVVVEEYLNEEETEEYKKAPARSYPMECEWDDSCGIGGGHHSRTGRHIAPAWAVANFLRQKLGKKWVPAA